jgi:beta-glucuronidase
VVDLYAARKPSFEALRLQASPINSAVLRKSGEGRYEFRIRTREQLPGYVLRGYSLRWLAYGYDDLPMEGAKTELPELHSGSSQGYEASFSASGIRRVVVDLMRPTRFSAITVQYLDEAGQK